MQIQDWAICLLVKKGVKITLFTVCKTLLPCCQMHICRYMCNYLIGVSCCGSCVPFNPPLRSCSPPVLKTLHRVSWSLLLLRTCYFNVCICKLSFYYFSLELQFFGTYNFNQKQNFVKAKCFNTGKQSVIKGCANMLTFYLILQAFISIKVNKRMKPPPPQFFKEKVFSEYFPEELCHKSPFLTTLISMMGQRSRWSHLPHSLLPGVQHQNLCHLFSSSLEMLGIKWFRTMFSFSFVIYTCRWEWSPF